MYCFVGDTKSAPSSPADTNSANSKGQTAMNSSMIAKCVDRIKKLSEADVMLDYRTMAPGKVPASALTPSQFSDEEMDIG